jgi:hypothetical protein
LQLICKLQEKKFTERVLINCRASFPVAMQVQLRFCDNKDYYSCAPCNFHVLSEADFLGFTKC